MEELKELRILLVEDDPGMALLVAERIEEVAGCTVRTVGSGAECREEIGRSEYDVALLDRGLPDCDGASLIPALLAADADLGIIMLTGADSAMSATETLKLGAWDYVVKTANLSYLDDLPMVISRCAERLAWRREEARLRAEVDLLLTAMRSGADAVIVTDPDSCVRFWNAAAEKLFGWAAEETVGKPMPLFAGDRADSFGEMRESAEQGRPIVGVETVLPRRDGTLIDVGLTLTGVRSPEGVLRGYVIVFRDISDRRQLERDRADFAAMLTHDIKNPVTVIRGYASLMTESDLPEEMRECAEGIERAAGQINNLVTDFLMSATIEAGTLKLAQMPVNIPELVKGAVQGFRAAAARVNVEVSQDGEPADVTITGDRMQLERALSNLIGNAIKFTAGGGKVSVAATLQDGDSIVLRVSDTGPGISPETVPHVFEKYLREKGTHGRIDGTGLGLFIVRNLVEAHGGNVSVESELGKGSTFIIRLPIQQSVVAA